MLRVRLSSSHLYAFVRFRTSHGRSANRTVLFHPIPFSFRSNFLPFSSSPLCLLSLSPLLPPKRRFSLPFRTRRSDRLVSEHRLWILSSVRCCLSESNSRDRDIARKSRMNQRSRISCLRCLRRVLISRPCFTPLFRKGRHQSTRPFLRRPGRPTTFDNAHAAEPLP